jgi:hypothetical protein
MYNNKRVPSREKTNRSPCLCEPVSAGPKSNIPWKRFLTGGDCAAQKPASAQNSSLRSAVSALMVRMSRKLQSAALVVPKDATYKCWFDATGTWRSCERPGQVVASIVRDRRPNVPEIVSHVHVPIVPAEARLRRGWRPCGGGRS